MKFNRKSILARFYLFFRDDGKLPSDFCTFCWGLIWRTIVSVGLSVLMVGVGFGLTIFFVGLGKAAWHHKIIAGIILAIISIAAFLIRKRKASQITNIVKVAEETIDSIKHDYCPRIEWQD